MPGYRPKEDELWELDVEEFLNSTMDPVKNILEYEPELFRDEDKEGEKDYPGLGKYFLDILAEEKAEKQARTNKENDLPGYKPKKEPEYLSYADRARQTVSDAMFNTYNTGEEWLMSEGEGDLAKGFINNFRSAIGTGVENFAYAVNDYAPWYKPAQKVVENNTAGKIRAQAQKQFANAKASGVNGNYVDLMDSVSRGLGYNALGFKAGNYIESGAETFNEYRKLRDSGYTKEEATAVLIKEAPLHILSAKADDYLGKNSRVDDVLYGKSGIAAKSDDIIEFENYKKILGKNAPETIEAFQELKYNSDDWNNFKIYADSVQRGELTSLADFELYKNTNKEIDDLLIGQIAGGEIKILEKSHHFTNRVIGSVYDRRDGVEPKNILKALQTQPKYEKEKDCMVYVLNGVCKVSVNPYTGKLIQVNPLSSRKGAKK